MFMGSASTPNPCMSDPSASKFPSLSGTRARSVWKRRVLSAQGGVRPRRMGWFVADACRCFGVRGRSRGRPGF
ncbi:hypothetical protein D3093_25640 (plasmid) [Azospirillum argentinense]|uniref:Uncharacterized protein n=1 Tax=Azospirillum argentinense TaxID=2970906 RepID=A0A4D8PSM1_9PROT|nr:hypothetical protein D3093_25640 [Azospirillum argentinense]